MWRSWRAGRQTAWRGAVAWVDRLTDLPVALELCRTGQLGPWAGEDPVYGVWVRHESGYHGPMARHLGPDILAACTAGHNPLPEWQAGWRARWPALDGGVAAGLEALNGAAEGHLAAMAAATDAGAGSPLGTALEKDLLRLFRAYARTPVALFAHLGLVALDVERLRAALVHRALYPDQQVA